MSDLSDQDIEFLAKLEEEFKDRFTEKDEEFMKVYNLEPSPPPVLQNWFVRSNRNNRTIYSKYNRDNNRHSYQGRRSGGYRNNYNRGYNDYEDRSENQYRRYRY